MNNNNTDALNEVDCTNIQTFYESTCRQMSHDRTTLLNITRDIVNSLYLFFKTVHYLPLTISQVSNSLLINISSLALEQVFTVSSPQSSLKS